MDKHNSNLGIKVCDEYLKLINCFWLTPNTILQPFINLLNNRCTSYNVDGVVRVTTTFYQHIKFPATQSFSQHRVQGQVILPLE